MMTIRRFVHLNITTPNAGALERSLYGNHTTANDYIRSVLGMAADAC